MASFSTELGIGPSALSKMLSNVAERRQIPGAQLCLARGEHIMLATAGTANTATGAPVTANTRFQLGSTTKPMLAFITHQLANEGLIDLDAPLPSFLDGDPIAGWMADRGITANMLLSHQSGLCGDAFLDLGDTQAAELDLVRKAATFPMLHAPGEDTSYCNLGYVLLGYVLSRLTETTWPDLLRRLITQPLGSDTLDPWPAPNAKETVSGHIGGTPASRNDLPASNGAAGTTLIGTAKDLCVFGTWLLNSLKGRGPLNSDAAIAMSSLAAPIAPNERGLGFGRGLMIYQEGQNTVFGHDGLTVGQQAFLRLFPRTDISLAFLGNGGDMRSAAADLFAALAHETGTEIPPPTYPSASEPKLQSRRYDRLSASLLIEATGDGPSLSIRNHEAWAADVYGPCEGPFDITEHPMMGTCIHKPGSDLPLGLHLTDSAAYLGMRRYNLAESHRDES
ncbi:MAG: serine hydrolase domain-containing protein [Pseudomonadota bacterium]